MNFGVIKFDIENLKDSEKLLSNAVYEENYKFLDNFCSQYSLRDEENKFPLHDCLLRKAQSSKMAQYLLEHNCFVSGKRADSDVTILSAESFTNINVVKTVLEYSKEYSNMVSEQSDIFYKYLERSSDEESFKQKVNLFLEHGFPLSKYDFFSCSKAIPDYIDRVNYCLEIGADPRNCKQFVQSLVSARDVSSFKKITKNTTLNLLYPDPLFYLLNSESHTQTTLDLASKATSENLMRLTAFKIPAWFGVSSSNSLRNIDNKITNFNPVNHISWITYITSVLKTDRFSDISKMIVSMSKHQMKKNNELLEFGVSNIKGNNVFHNLFEYNEHRRVQVDRDFIDVILNNFNLSNLNYLIMEKNNLGNTPLDNLFLIKSSPKAINEFYVDDSLEKILISCGYNLDYHKETQTEKKTIYELIKTIYEVSGSNENRINDLNHAYLKYELSKSLSENLNKNKTHKL
jgi:hypothetical protein